MSGGYVGSQSSIVGVSNYTKEEAAAKFAQLTAANNFVQMPQVGGSPIVENGSNANGAWIKWADGTMICSALKSDASIDATDVLGAGYISHDTVALAFPAAFSQNPHASDASVFVNSNGVAANTGRGWGQISELVATSLSMTTMGFTTSCSVFIGYIAIGKWK